MLVNRKEKSSKKKKTKKDPELEQENIQSLRSWVRKIEQSTTSIGSRLSAVEKRISSKKHDSTNSSIPGNILEGPIERIFQNIQDEKKKQHSQELGALLDAEFTVMQDEIVQQHQDLDEMKQQLNDINTTLNEINTKLQHLDNATGYLSSDLTTRVAKIERREPPVVRFGTLEVPIEITGIVGGILAFIVALLVVIDYKEIIISPLFLILIGILLIGSALIKSFNFRSSTLTEPPQQIHQAQPVNEENEFTTMER